MNTTTKLLLEIWIYSSRSELAQRICLSFSIATALSLSLSLSPPPPSESHWFDANLSLSLRISHVQIASHSHLCALIRAITAYVEHSLREEDPFLSYKMRRWMSGVAKPCPKLTSKTEDTTDSIRCGKWVLRATKIRRNRAQDTSPVKKQPTTLTKKQLTTPTKKRKRHASPTSSANSVVGENNVQAKQIGKGQKKLSMSSNEIPWHEPGVLSSDEDDFMDLEALEMLAENGKIPQRTSKMSGQEYVTFLLKGHPRTIKDVLRVDKHTFRALVRELIQRGQIEWDHKKVSVEESLAMFLYICGHSERHRLAADKFQHSTSTISDHFNFMRRALCNLAPYIIKPPNLEETPPEILHDERYYPWFKDCVGAIDGTHIQASVPNEMETPFRGRKGTKTQNVMVVCSFDMKFKFVYPGWEGSAHDGRVFLAAVTNPDFMFPQPPVNKYYVVDSAYTNMLGYLAPYKGQRYHRDEWNGVNTVFASPMELFNYKHSSLRNVIQRCIGVLKARFPILKSMPSYSPAKQPSIVTACCVVHNMIVIHHGRDEFFEDYDSDSEWEGDSDGDDGDAGQVEHVNTSRQSVEMMGNRRDQIAMEMWEAY